MSLCVLGLAHLLIIPTQDFSLAWTHSVEKTQWQEIWQVKSGLLHLVEARIKGSGAGMEPAAGAKLHNGWWIYHPATPAQKELVLAASGMTGTGWTLCANNTCWALEENAIGVISIKACRSG